MPDLLTRSYENELKTPATSPTTSVLTSSGLRPHENALTERSKVGMSRIRSFDVNKQGVYTAKIMYVACRIRSSLYNGFNRRSTAVLSGNQRSIFTSTHRSRSWDYRRGHRQTRTQVRRDLRSRNERRGSLLHPLRPRIDHSLRERQRQHNHHLPRQRR